MAEKYVLTYSRDTTMVMEEIWLVAQTESLEKMLGKKNPYGAPNIFHMDRGVIEIWENAKSIGWIKESIKERVLAEPGFLAEAIGKYGVLYGRVMGMAKSSPLNLDELKEFADLVSRACGYFVIWYFVAINETLPDEVRAPALKVRESDNLFDGSDKVIRDSIRSIYPAIKDVPVALKTEELANGGDQEVLRRRFESWIFATGSIDEVVGFDDFVNRHSEFDFERIEVVASDILKGQPAFIGKASGIVKIVRRKDEIDKVGDGDILVSLMTTPDFIPAMKKAAAFVTDEGGITCHAAIIARELGKPCIIGTKVATKVLKDGDMVEVDAEKGMVKIIKKT